MTLRQLTANEIPLMYEGGKTFLEEAKFPAPFNPDAFRRQCAELLEWKLGEVWAAFEGETILGAIGFAYSKCPFTGDATALEQFWFVIPAYRKSSVGLQLWEKFEERARDKGAKRIAMVHLASLDLQGLYEARGYKLVEQTFWRML